MKHHIYHIFCALFLLLTLSVVSCKDDIDFGPNGFGEGEAVISAEVTFKPLMSALGSRAVSGGTPGDAIKSIDQLWVVVFDSKGELCGADKGNGSGIYQITNYKTDTNTASPSDAPQNPSTDPNDTGSHKAESETQKATFTLPVSLPYGNYKMYAVANVDLSKYADEIAASDNPIETLQNIQLTWNSEKVAENNQMFGYFTTYNETDNGKSKGFDAPLVTIASKTVSLRAWLKRAASKVTIAFDGTGLKENIYIYLISAQIKDIPKKCLLGADNVPGNGMDKSGYMGEDDSAEDYPLIYNGQSISYNSDYTFDGNDENTAMFNENWPATITSGAPIFGFKGRVTGTTQEQIVAQHGEDVNALYFYENMQGEGLPGTESDKHQVVDRDNVDKTKPTYPNGGNKDDSAFKDAKPYGSYIEVKAYYISNNRNDVTRGFITYRFMLGKDTHLDYNAERNHHYKLTMRFKGYANDVDWHIEYPRTPGIETPNPYFISYLYNHSMMLPLQINTEPGVTVTGLKAEITSNNWAPANPQGLLYWEPLDPSIPEYSNNNYPCNGFLSLHKTTETQVVKEVSGSKPLSVNSNYDYYVTEPKRGSRVYFSDAINIRDGEYTQYPSATTPNLLNTDKFYVKTEKQEDGSNIYRFQLPMYTRAKQLIKQTAYTGNNPYVAYMREAVVHFTATLSNNSTYEQDVTIKQVRRVVNPKGIYRKAGSTEEFNVVLKVLPKEEATSFIPLTSQGPWKAYVIKGQSVAKIDGADKDEETIISSMKPGVGNETIRVKSLYGKTGSDIAFKVDFTGKQGDAVIRVEYNDFTCYHLIFLKNGYDTPVDLGTGTRWYNKNMISSTVIAASPLDEGSLFKWGNWNGIDALKNKNSSTKEYWTSISPNDFIGNCAGQPGSLLTEKEWTDIKAKSATKETTFGEPERTNTRMATYEDYKELYKHESIEQGYGVLYGDGVTTTLDDINDVYGYDRNNTERGMRGCFVYNRETGANIFFPIGASGYGHRMANQVKPTEEFKYHFSSNVDPTTSPVTPQAPTWGQSYVGTSYKGVLRYSCNARWGWFNAFAGAYQDGVFDAPLFFDIYRRPGAIYWLAENVGNKSSDFDNDGDVGENVVAWDFNYFTFDFYPLSASNVGSGADACFVRCVAK